MFDLSVNRTREDMAVSYTKHYTIEAVVIIEENYGNIMNKILHTRRCLYQLSKLLIMLFCT